MIRLNDKCHKLVTDGDKRQTIRMGRRDIELGSNTLSFMNSPDLRIIVTEITYKWYGNINDKDAKLDGFDNKKELMEELVEYYPFLKETSEMTLIKFYYLNEDTEDTKK